MQVDWTAVLTSVISGIFSFLIGHRRGRSVYRSGDYRDMNRPSDDG